MKKTPFLLLLLPLILTGCGGDTTTEKPSEDVSVPSESTTEVSSESTSEDKPSESTSEVPSESTSEDSSTSEELEVGIYTSIKECKSYADAYSKLVNEAGVYHGEAPVKLDNLQLCFALDSGTTKSLYGSDQYKLMFTDGSDYIYTRCCPEFYKYIKEYKGEKGTYDIQGKLGYYNGEIEVALTAKPLFKGKDAGFVVDYSKLANKMSVEEFYNYAKTVQLNTKGNGYSKIVALDGKCLAKDINNTNMFFGNGDYIFQTHGHDKVTNTFEKNKNYTVIGAVSIYHFKPSIEIIDFVNLDSEITVNSATRSLTAKQFYNYSYKKDDGYHPSNASYAKHFETPVKLQGYLTVYAKDGWFYTVISDTFVKDGYAAYTNAVSGNALFVCNENMKHFDEAIAGSKGNEFYQYVNEDIKLDMEVLPYEWNTSKYPTAYLKSFKPAI